MCEKPASQQVVMLALEDGNVLVMADEQLPSSLLVHCSSVPMTVVLDEYTTEQFTAFLQASAEFYQWAYYLDEEEFQRRAMESILQRVEPATHFPIALCLRNIKDSRQTLRQAA